MAGWPADVLDALAVEREIDIETTSPEGELHHTTIWVVVDGDDVFVRSVHGQAGRWYQELTSRGEGALYLGGGRVPVRPIAATDADSVARCSRAFEAKYADDPSMPPMLEPGTLETTLRLVPAEG